MNSVPAFSLMILGPGDARLLLSMRALFSEAFEDPDTYATEAPDPEYLETLLASDLFIALAALKGGTVVGGLTAYELPKFERRRKEVFLYDVAVSSADRRQGIATAMIRELQALAARRGASVVFVQAHLVDEPAVELYTKLGTRADVAHFDLPPIP